ncbi:MAG: hypothetical protein AABX88_02490 [Nanoarchaeota archaeon]
MLVAVLKYIDQLKLQIPCLNNNAKELLEWTRSLGQSGGGCAEHFGGNLTDARMFFYPFDIDIPILDENSRTNNRTPFRIGTEAGREYGTYISPSNELIFSYESEKTSEKKFTISFQPEEAEHLVKGLMYQSANGLGRTSARQLIEIINYRFSDYFKKI